MDLQEKHEGIHVSCGSTQVSFSARGQVLPTPCAPFRGARKRALLELPHESPRQVSTFHYSSVELSFSGLDLQSFKGIRALKTEEAKEQILANLKLRMRD